MNFFKGDMLDTKQFIIKHKDYKPKKASYGFIGKKFPLKYHKYRDSEYASENKQKILDALDDHYDSLSILHQVHGDKSIIVDKSVSDGDVDADSHVTKNKKVLLGIETADCVPILFIDEKNEVVGGAHAGWRGAIGGIIDSTIKQMQALGAEMHNTDIVVGPCIHQQSYEVDDKFFATFIEEKASNRSFFKPSKTADKYMFDLPGYVKAKLMTYNPKNIFDIGINTFESQDDFFSYRRFKDQETGKGHVLSIVGLKC